MLHNQSWGVLAFFVLEALLFGIALGLRLQKLESRFALSKASLFLLGVSSTPLVLGVYFMLLAFIPFPLHKAIAILPVWAFILLVFWAFRKTLCSNLSSAFCAITRQPMIFGFCIGLPFILGLYMYNFISGFAFSAFTYPAVPFTLILLCFSSSLIHKLFSHTIKINSKRHYTIGLILALSPSLLLILLGLFPSFYWNWPVVMASYLGQGLPTALGTAILAVMITAFLCAVAMSGIFLISFSLQNKPKISSLIYIYLVSILPMSFFCWFYLVRPNRFWLFMPFLALVLSLVVLYLFLRTAQRKNPNSAIFAVSAFLRYRQITNAIFILAALFASYYFFILCLNSLFAIPWRLFDASQYLGEAKYFLDNFSPSGITGFYGSADGAIVGTTHHFAWSSYLAFAMLHCKGIPGFGNDFAATGAILLSIVFALAALLALLSVLRSKKVMFVGFIMFISALGTQNILSAHSRDGFRIAGLLFFFTVFYGALETRLHGLKPQWPEFVLPLVGAFYAMASHPINALAAAPLVAAVFLWVLIKRQLNLHFLVVCIACGAGAALALFSSLLNFLQTGSMSGNYIALADILKGTPYETAYFTHEQIRLLGTESFLERLFFIVQREHAYILILGFVASILLFMLLLGKALKTRQANFSLLAGLAAFTNLLMINDFIRWYGFPMSKWFVMNMRYPYHIAVFSIVAVCALLAEWEKKQISSCFIPAKILKRWALPAAAAAAAAYIAIAPAPKTILLSPDTPPPAVASEYYGSILTNNIFSSYYYDNQALSLFSTNARDILTAKTESEFKSALKQHNIRVIASNETYYKAYLAASPYQTFISNPKNFSEINNYHSTTIYILAD